MISQLLLATPMVVVTVLVHGIGISQLARILRFDPTTAEAHRWRLVSAIEGVNGILLLGWSTAFFVTVVARLRR